MLIGNLKLQGGSLSSDSVIPYTYLSAKPTPPFLCRIFMGLVSSIIHKCMDSSGGRTLTFFEQLLYARYGAGILLLTVIGHEDMSKNLT